MRDRAGGNPRRSRAQAADLVEALLDGGVTLLQVRCKDMGSAEQLETVRDLIARARRRAAAVIVNDRVDIALAAGAAGVHVGQSDLPLSAVRQMVAGRAPAMVVGVSTHSVAEARRAEQGGASYVGFGPMFATASKADALSPRSLDELRAVRAAIAIPIVAIGGLTPDTAPAVLQAGATAVAMIGAIESAADPAALARRLLA